MSFIVFFFVFSMFNVWGVQMPLLSFSRMTSFADGNTRLATLIRALYDNKSDIRDPCNPIYVALNKRMSLWLCK